MTDNTSERFENKYMPITGTGCWLWLATCTRLGYGQFRVKDKMAMAHRVSYEMYIGQIPVGMCVLHKCDVPSCVNPNHLYLGTHQDNSTDMVNKGRVARGSKRPDSVLTELQVMEIKEMLAKGESQASIAKKYNVSPTLISHIYNGRSWKHV